MLEHLDNVQAEAINRLCKTRRIKNLRRELNYFIRNQKRMRYDKIAEEGLPMGSGAMESAVRRVVNLRLKGAAVFWLRETAEAMLNAGANRIGASASVKIVGGEGGKETGY